MDEVVGSVLYAVLELVVSSEGNVELEDVESQATPYGDEVCRKSSIDEDVSLDTVESAV